MGGTQAGATYGSQTGTGTVPTSTDELSDEESDGDKVRSVEEVKHEKRE